MTTLALFVGHGNPMNVISPNNIFNQGFRQITQSFTRPNAILCVSAHWYTPALQVQTGENPPMIYDFHGFPDELYQVNYPAKGCLKLAHRVMDLLAEHAVQDHPSRGYDHGMWAVLKHLYPDADIPVIQLSLDSRQSTDWHWRLAEKLRPLRDEGVLILGSGDIVHNLRLMNWQHINTLDAGYDWAFAFRDAINQAIEKQDVQTLIEFEKLGNMAHWSVPTPEHYLPLLYVMAVRDAAEQVTLFNDILVGGAISMTSVLVGK